MGIGLVDPILPSISHQLHASPSQVTLLFTSYLVVTAVAMLITNWVSSRIGAKKTLIVGLALIVVFSAAAGASPTIGAIIGFRAGWGVGNALFIATSLAVIVASASGGFAGAIVLYETALGVGIAMGPLLGGILGEVSWRGPFFGVSALMAIALIATVVLVEKTPKPHRRPSQGVILAAIDQTPVAGLVTEAAARLALADGQIVHVVHAQEGVTAGDVGFEAEDPDAARDLVRAHLDRLAAHRVPAEGQVLLHAADHGGAGRLIAEYATSIRATTIVLGAPSHGGLSALMDASASQELMRHTSSNVLIVNPAAPPAPVTANGSAAVAMARGSGSGSETV